MAEPVTPKNQTGFFATTRPDPLVTPFKGTTCADDAKQAAIRRHLGLHNNDDMFLDDVQPFLAHYLPTEVTDVEVNKCISKMLSERPSILKKTGKRLSWTKYHKREPAESGTTENVAFEHLGEIIEKIMEHNPREATEGETKQGLYFRLCPDNWLVSDIEGGNFKIDACFTEIEQLQEVNNRYIYIPIELKQKRTILLRLEVHQQILGACHHILNEDPRRMWIFGLTFENDVVSVWYFSRSHSVKTFAANWLEDPRLLVKIILSFINADHSALGIDPMVHVGPKSNDKKTLSYVYEVPREIAGDASVFYKTGQIRSPARPMCIAGRVTRVWEVTQVTAADGEIEVNPGKKAILKDVWLAADTGTETENVDKIFEAIDTFVSTRLEAEIRDELKKNPGATREAITSNSQTMKRLMKQLINHDKRFEYFDDETKERLRGYFTDKNYRSMFLTKLYDWKGHLSKEIEPSAQSCPNLFPRDPDNLTDANYSVTKAPSARRSTLRSDQGRIQSGIVGSMTQPEYTPLGKRGAQNSRGYASKQQIRVVYEEVCDSLYEVGTLGDVVDILCQAIDAAHILYAVGWVHRDLSAGNILAIRTGPNKTWKVKLADFEFARPMIDEARKVRSDPRTGMPTEILSRHYLYENYFVKGKSAPRVLPTLLDDAPLLESEAETLATQFNLSPTHPAYQKFKGIAVIACLGSKRTIPADADSTKIPARNSIVNHNFQHDLESIWWILLWFVTMNVNWATSFDWAHDIFDHNISNFKPRRHLFTNSLEGNDSFSDYLKPELASIFPHLLETLRSRMQIEYIKREIFGHLETPESYSQIHGNFSQAFRRFAAIGGDWRDLEIKCGVNPRVMDLPLMVKEAEQKPVVTGSKRGRDDNEPLRTRSGIQDNNKKSRRRN